MVKHQSEISQNMSLVNTYITFNLVVCYTVIKLSFDLLMEASSDL